MSLRPSDHMASGDRNAAAEEQLPNAMRRAGQKPRPVLNDQADVLRMKGVNVLSG